MRSTVRLALVLALLVLTAPVMAAPSVPTAGFQLQADGLLHVPSGGEVASTGFPLSTMIGKGPGFALTATMGLRPHLAIGARVAHFGSTGEREAWFVDPLSPYGLGPFHEERRLRVTMLHAILQHRAFYGRRFEWSLDLGGGIMMSRERLVLDSATGTKASRVGVQRDPSYTFGTGLAWWAAGNTDLVASARWNGSFTTDGAVWSKDDSPNFMTWSLGLRYPHDTH